MIRQFSRFNVLHKLGQGAMSAVYLARDPVLSRLVAIKVLHPDLVHQPAVLERFFKEAKTVSRVSSPNVVEVFDFGVEGQVPFLVLEFVDGQTLGRIIGQLGKKPMDPIVSASLSVQVAEGLTITGEAGIVHRDLKPDNLLLSRKGLVKISDFGICHLKDHTMTATGQVLGSPRFMSPEQVRGEKPLTVQSDLFSLGAVLYTLLAGRPPFIAETVPELFQQIVEQPHQSLGDLRSGLDRELVRLVDRLLQKSPIKRGDGPGEACIALRRYLHKKKVLDPIERIAQYIQHLASVGVQTTSNLSPEQVRLWLGTIDLDKPFQKKRVPRGVIYTAASLVMAGALGAGGTWIGLKKRPRTDSGLHDGETPAASNHYVLKASESPKVSPMESAKLKPAVQRIPNRPVTIPEPDASKQDIDVQPMGPSVISIQTLPPFAEVLLDGHSIGRTPMQDMQVPNGKHRLTLKSRLGRSIDTSVVLKSGPQSYKFTLLENPEGPDLEGEP